MIHKCIPNSNDLIALKKFRVSFFTLKIYEAIKKIRVTSYEVNIMQICLMLHVFLRYEIKKNNVSDVNFEI